MPLDATPFNKLVGVHEGMGATADTCIVGRENDRIRYKCDSNSGKWRAGESAATSAVRIAMQGEKGQRIHVNDTGGVELLYYSPLHVKGMEWVIISSISLDEIMNRQVDENNDNLYRSHMGYQVVGRASSVEALSTFQANPQHFDLVITDQTMPNMTGKVLAAHIAKIRPDLPVVLCTGFNVSIDEEKALSLGIRACVKKPILRTELAATVRQTLDGCPVTISAEGQTL